MYISEIFYSIQGEGELTGVPSVFVRTSGCNLRCVWCDTKYSSWNPEGQQMSVSEIIDRVNDFACDHVVITGGEPMIAKDIRYLVSRLKMHALHVTIETAATIKPEGIEVDLASLSPKLSNSTPSEVLAGPWSEKHERLRMQPDVIAEWLNWYHCQLKFVVATEQDVAEILALLKVLQDHDIERSQIMLMPEGVDSATLKSRSGWVSNLCKEYGWRYCQRLQIELYGNTKGT